MKRIDDRTVELTPLEEEAATAFEQLLDDGYSTDAAAVRIGRQFPMMLTQEFLDYLASS